MPADQTAYRWRNDDGSESTATWKAAENTTISQLIRNTVRLRLQMDTTGTFSGGSTNPALQYRKVGESIWQRPNQEGAAAITVGTTNTAATSSAGGTSVAPGSTFSTSTHANKALLVMFIWQKPTTANGGTVTTPSGWTFLGKATGGGYGGTLGADTGNTNVWVYYKVGEAGEPSSYTVTIGDNNVARAKIIRIDRGSVEVDWQLAFATGEDTSGDASFSAACGSDPGLQAGDLVIGAMCVPTDVNSAQWSGQSFTAAGVTFGAVTEWEDGQTSTGNDLATMGAYAFVTAGPSSGNPTFAATSGGATLTDLRGPAIVVRVRGVWNQRFVMKPSANVGIAGATTAQLTPPGAKTTASFASGQTHDEASEMSSKSLGADLYTENEWCLEATELAQVGDQYEFRATDEQVPLDSYTVIPQLTIASAGGASAASIGFMM